MRPTVLIPTLDGRAILRQALQSLERQTLAADVVVIDNGSGDGTAAMVGEEFPSVRLVRNETNRGFGRPLNDVALALEAEVIVLLNNDVVCAPSFLERLCAPFAEPGVGMVAGVLTQWDAAGLVDSAGIELDRTLKSWDLGWNRPLAELAGAPAPVGPCGGAAAYRLAAFRAAGGFDPALFAYWEDVDLAIRLREAGWRCVLARGAVAEHRHGATLGAGSPRQRALDAFGRGYVLGKYGVVGSRRDRLAAALLDWPVLVAHAVARRDPEPARARRRGIRAGLAAARPRPLGLASVSWAESQRRLWSLPLLRITGRLPAHLAAGRARARS